MLPDVLALDGHALRIGPRWPHQVNVLIENPKGSTVRRVFDRQRQALVVAGKLDPVPFDYGLIPETEVDPDGDELDAFLWPAAKVRTGNIYAATPLATLLLDDGDHKVIATLGHRTRVPAVTRRRAEEWLAPWHAILGWLERDDTLRLIEEAHPLSVPGAAPRRDNHEAGTGRPLPGARLRGYLFDVAVLSAPGQGGRSGPLPHDPLRRGL